MADSFFSSFGAACRKRNAPYTAPPPPPPPATPAITSTTTKSGSNGFHHRQRLIKQAADSYAYSKKCEANLHRKEEHYTRRRKQFLHQIEKLKTLNKELSAALQIKDKLLREKSHELIQRNTEIVQLKDEVQELRLQLAFKETLLSTLQRDDHDLDASSNPSSDTDDERTPHRRRQPQQQQPQQQQSSSSSQTSASSPSTTSFLQPRTKSDLPTQSLPNIMETTPTRKQSSDVTTVNHRHCGYDSVLAKYCDEIPFIHRKSSTQTSSLSACAVKISFPSPTVAMPNESNMIGATPLQLSPISESKTRDDYIPKKVSSSTSPPTLISTPDSPMPLIKTSDDNKHIDQEWGQSIAGEDMHSAQTVKTEESERSPVPKDVAEDEQEQGTVGMPSIENAFEFVKSYEKNSNDEHDHDHDIDDAVSYCTDNTYDMLEMMMEVGLDTASSEIDHELDVGGHGHDDDDAMQMHHNTASVMRYNAVSKPTSSSGHFSKQSHGHISRSDLACDGVIRAPINIYSSFLQFQLQAPMGSHNRNNATVIPRSVVDEK